MGAVHWIMGGLTFCICSLLLCKQLVKCAKKRWLSEMPYERTHSRENSPRVIKISVSEGYDDEEIYAAVIGMAADGNEDAISVIKGQAALVVDKKHL